MVLERSELQEGKDPVRKYVPEISLDLDKHTLLLSINLF
jgi:hypothetical protein